MALPQGIVPLNSRIASLKEALNDHKVLLLVGKKASGKTSLLVTLEAELKDLGASVVYPKQSDGSPLAFVQEDLPPIALIDDIDLRPNHENFLTDFLLKSKNKKIICTLSKLPTENPELIFGSYCYHIPPLDLNEIVLFCRFGALNLDSFEEGVLSELRSISNANPQSLKMLIGTLKIQNFDGKRNSLEKLSRDYERALFQNLQSNHIENLGLLHRPALILFDTNLEHKFLSELPHGEVEILEQLALLRRSHNFLELASKLKEYVLENLSQEDINQLRHGLLQDNESRISKKEVIHQQIELGNTDEAIELLFENLDTGDNQFLLHCIENLSARFTIEQFAALSDSFLALNRVDKLREILDSHKTDRGDPKHLQALLKIARRLGENEKVRSFATVLLEMPLTKTERIEILHHKFNVEKNLDHKQARATLDDLKSLVETNSSQVSQKHLAQYFLNEARLAVHTSPKDAIELTKRAVLALKDKSEKNYRLALEIELAAAKSDCHLHDEGMKELVELRGKALELYLFDEYRYATTVLAHGLFVDGCFEEARKALAPLLLGLGEKTKLEHSEWIACYFSIFDHMRSISSASFIRFCEAVMKSAKDRSLDFRFNVFQGIQSYLKGKSILEVLDSADVSAKNILMNRILEMEFRRGFPCGSLEFSSESSPQDMALLFSAFPLSASYLLKNEISRSRRTLESVEETQYSFPFRFHTTRNLIGLSLIDMHEGDLKSCSSRFKEIEENLVKMDPDQTLDLYYIMRSLYEIKDNHPLKAKKVLKSISQDSQYHYLANIILRQLKDKDLYLEPQILDSQRSWMDFIFEFLKPPFLKKVTLETATSKKSHFRSDLGDLSKLKYDLVIDQDEGALISGKKRIDFSKKRVLLDLLTFFIENRGSHFSKEELTTKVWIEIYNPLVHDPRVYTSVKRLRELLKGVLSVDAVKGKYGIKGGLNFALLKEEVSEIGQFSEKTRWILNYLRKNSKLTRAEIEKALQIKTTVAKGEIKPLLDQGLIELKGKGKNSFYQLRKT